MADRLFTVCLACLASTTVVNLLTIGTDNNIFHEIDGDFFEKSDLKFNANYNLWEKFYASHYPLVPLDPIEVAKLLGFLEHELREIPTKNPNYPRLAHQQQVIYRVLSEDISFSQQVLGHLPHKWRNVAERHLAARREFLEMSSASVPKQYMPAWKIIQPESAEQLLSYYLKAEKNTGIEWEVLASINLVETGMGRIDGISVANAQGPMQFLPTTWRENGIGMNGDIRDPHDSIQAAARYLVRRGGLNDIKKGLWGYNNSYYYGRAIMQYVSLLKEDPKVFYALYNWEIHYRSYLGDLWLPVGYKQIRQIPISTYLKNFPHSLPPTTLPSTDTKPQRG